MKVRDLMSRDVITLHAESVMADAEEVMGFKRFRHLPVVEGKRLVGIITHRDLLRHYLSSGSATSWVEHQVHMGKVKVRDVMQKKVEAISPDASLVDAAYKLEALKLGCLVVADQNGELQGIITEADFMKLARVLLEHHGDDDEAQKRLEAWLTGNGGPKVPPR